MVEMAMFNVQRAITQKVGKSELQFMCSASCLTVLYICVKIRENILDGIRVIRQIRMIAAQTDGQITTQHFGGYNKIPSGGIKMTTSGHFSI